MNSWTQVSGSMLCPLPCQPPGWTSSPRALSVLKSLCCEGRITGIALPFASKQWSFWITLDSFRPENKNETTHLRYLIPSKCQNVIALGTGHCKISRPKINSFNVFYRKGYAISYQTEEKKVFVYTNKQLVRIYFSGKVVPREMQVPPCLCWRKSNI